MEDDNTKRSNYILRMNIGGTRLAVLLIRAGRKKTDGVEFLEWHAVPTKGSWQKVLGILALRGGEMVKRHDILPDDCMIGTSCGGLLDSGSGVMLSPPNLPGQDEVPITKHMEQKLGMPARFKNDTDACALTEWRYEVRQGCHRMIFLTFGAGLEAGPILNSRLYQRACGMVGEAGHIRLDQDGPVGYEKAGGSEGLCSGGGAAQLARRMAAEAFKEGKNVSYSGRERLDFITAKDATGAAECGMEDALQVYGYSGRYFGRGLAVLIDIPNPERIVVGSIFAKSGKLTREETEEELRKGALPESLTACTVVLAALRDRIGDYGAVVAVLE